MPVVTVTVVLNSNDLNEHSSHAGLILFTVPIRWSRGRVRPGPAPARPCQPAGLSEPQSAGCTVPVPVLPVAAPAYRRGQ